VIKPQQFFTTIQPSLPTPVKASVISTQEGGKKKKIRILTPQCLWNTLAPMRVY